MRVWRKALVPMVAAGLLGTVNAPPAMAQAVTSLRPQSLATAIQAAGYRAELTKDSSGDPMIRSSSSGTDFAVFFYNCKDNTGCTTIQFFVAFAARPGATLQSVNHWNATNRFARAYLADNGDARLEMDLNIEPGGIGQPLFVDSLAIWTSLMADFEKRISAK